MGLLILMGLIYLYAIGYWHYWGVIAKRDRRWSRRYFCLKRRNQLLVAGGLFAALAIAIKYSL